MHCSQSETTNHKTEKNWQIQPNLLCEWSNEVEAKENPLNAPNCLFSFNYGAVMSTEINNQIHKNPGFAVFLLLRAAVSAADASVSNWCNYGQTKYVQRNQEKKINKEMVEKYDV